jgi:hypothetical protein
MRGLLAVLSLCCLGIAAQAQDQPPPCSRGSVQMKIAGVSIDELRCELSIVRMDRAAVQMRLDKVMTLGSMQEAELKAMQKHEAELAEWFRAWFGGAEAAGTQ